MFNSCTTRLYIAKLHERTFEMLPSWIEHTLTHLASRRKMSLWATAIEWYCACDPLAHAIPGNCTLFQCIIMVCTLVVFEKQQELLLILSFGMPFPVNRARNRFCIQLSTKRNNNFAQGHRYSCTAARHSECPRCQPRLD